MKMTEFKEALDEERTEVFDALRSLTHSSDKRWRPGGGGQFDWVTWPP